jgi:hypothetical protein
VAGVEMLYSREFLEAARQRLAPGGVYAQWFHVYESNPAVLDLVLRTYASVFPHISVWYTLASDLVVLGFNRPDRALDVVALEERFDSSDFSEAFERVDIESFSQFVAHELLPLDAFQPADRSGDIHTLRHPILSYRAARAFFRGRMGSLAPYQDQAQKRIGVRNSLLRGHARGKQPLPEDIIEAATYESCRFNRNEHCGTFFAFWSLLYPQSPKLLGALSASRQKASEASKYLTPKNLAAIQALFVGEDPTGRSAYSAVEAERLTGLYRRHYNHIVPFDPDYLDQVWERCQGADCEERRIRAETQIGLPQEEIDAEADRRSSRQDREPMSRTALSSIVIPLPPPVVRFVAR